MAKIFKAADNRGGRVRSLFVDPVLQESSRSHLGTTPNRGAEFPSDRNVQEHGKTTDLPKDEAKEGTGFWLLNVSGGPRQRSLFPMQPPRGPGRTKGSVHADEREGDLP